MDFIKLLTINYKANTHKLDCTICANIKNSEHTALLFTRKRSKKD